MMEAVRFNENESGCIQKFVSNIFIKHKSDYNLTLIQFHI